MDEEGQREWKRAQEEKKRNDESYGKGAIKKAKATKAAAEKAKWNAKLSQQSLLASGKARLQALLKRFLATLYFINNLFTMLPPGCASTYTPRRRFNPSWQQNSTKPRPINVFPLLKSGRRNVIVAVNDCGTTSLIRFGEAEFDRWRLAGTDRVN
jgi:hypothetical protein